MSFLAPIGAKLLVGLAIAGAIVAALVGVRNSGKAAEKAEQTQRNAIVRKAQDEIVAPDVDDIDAIFRSL